MTKIMETGDVSSQGSDSILAGSGEELIEKKALLFQLLLFHHTQLGQKR